MFDDAEPMQLHSLSRDTQTKVFLIRSSRIVLNVKLYLLGLLASTDGISVCTLTPSFGPFRMYVGKQESKIYTSGE
jgi:hypothetical protein